MLVFRCCIEETPKALPQYHGLKFDTRQLDLEFVFFMLCHLLNLATKCKLFLNGTGCYVQICKIGVITFSNVLYRIYVSDGLQMRKWTVETRAGTGGLIASIAFS